jgi:hypothetical protein
MPAPPLLIDLFPNFSIVLVSPLLIHNALKDPSERNGAPKRNAMPEENGVLGLPVLFAI